MIARQRRILVAFLSVACLAQMALVVLSRLDQNRIDDDAYMFVRYATNTLHHGAISWNPEGPPTYGPTSLGYFALVLVLRALLHVDATWVLLGSTLLCGVAFVCLAVVLARKTPVPDSAGYRGLAQVTALLFLSWGAPGLANHFVNGMDALFALVWLTGILLAAIAWFREPTRGRALSFGVLAGMLLWVRPDTLLFAFLPALMVWVCPPTIAHRRSALVVLASACAVSLLLASGAWIYFDSPVPLSVYGKVLRGYGPDMQQVYARFPAEQLLLFARDHAVPLTLATFGIFLLARLRGPRQVALEIGLWSAAVLFVVFHRFFVLAIMGSHQRFYYPILPVALFLGIRVVLVVVQTPTARRVAQRWLTSRQRTSVAFLLCGVAALASLVPSTHTAWQALRHAPLLQHMTVWDHYEHGWPSGYWIRLDGFSRLPDDLVLATTEVGLPGVMNPEKTIIDIAGLNDDGFARSGFTAQALFARQHPDLFLLPRSHYAALRSELTRSPVFRSEYEVYTPPQGLQIALYRNSRYYGAMRRVLGMGDAVGQ